MSAMVLIPAGALGLALAAAGVAFWVFVDRWLDDERALDDG